MHVVAKGSVNVADLQNSWGAFWVSVRCSYIHRDGLSYCVFFRMVQKVKNNGRAFIVVRHLFEV